MSLRRSLMLYLLKESQTLNNFLARCLSLRNDRDLNIHRDLYTHLILLDLLTLLTPSKNSGGNYFRCGANHDGGYVIDRNIALNSHVISLGVGDNISFDYQISSIARTVTLCDFSIDSLPFEIPKSSFLKKKVVKSVSNEREEITLAQLLKNLPQGEKVIIKMDIEGSEWEVLDNFDWREYPLVCQLVIEFHGLLDRAKNFDAPKMLEVIQNLTNEFVVVNFHPNNYGDFECFLNIPIPDVVELTLVRKGWITSEFSNLKPSQLNAPNNPNVPEIEMFCN